MKLLFGVTKLKIKSFSLYFSFALQVRLVVLFLIYSMNLGNNINLFIIYNCMTNCNNAKILARHFLYYSFEGVWLLCSIICIYFASPPQKHILRCHKRTLFTVNSVLFQQETELKSLIVMLSSFYLTPLSDVVHLVWPQAFTHCINKTKQQHLYFAVVSSKCPFPCNYCILSRILCSSFICILFSRCCADPVSPTGDHETVMCCNLVCLCFVTLSLR